MPNVPNNPDAPTDERVAQLEQLVAELRQDLLGLDNRLFDEVRTRRLVVIDDKDAERIVAETGAHSGHHASLQVRAAESPDTWVGLYASNEMAGDQPVAQMDLSVDGAIHTQLVASPAGGWCQPERPAHVRRTDVRTAFTVAGETVLEGYSDLSANPRKADG